MIRIFSDVSSARCWWMGNQRDLFPALPEMFKQWSLSHHRTCTAAVANLRKPRRVNRLLVFILWGLKISSLLAAIMKSF
jgi:hypothetical protein